ncbi:MAG: hypothetical protein WBA93_33515 [Microcoleaceae cyanobacterium]
MLPDLIFNSPERINLETKKNLTNEERELIMNLSPAYLKWREDVRQ